MMLETYDDWLLNRVQVRDDSDAICIRKLKDTKLKNRLLRKVDQLTRTIALSLRDDYISEKHVELKNPENRYSGSISLLEFIYALCWPYEYEEVGGIKRGQYKYNKHGKLEGTDLRIDKRNLVFWSLIDEFKKNMDRALIFNTMCDEFTEGRFRAFLLTKIPNIEKMSVNHQFRIFLRSKKLIKLDKTDIQEMIFLTKED